MPQLSLYIDDATMETLRVSARGEGISMSKYAARLIRNRAAYGGWPQGYWESVYGCLNEDLSFEDDVLNADLDDACDWFDSEDADQASPGRAQ